ncbi:MAG: phosphoglycerate kinase [Desulfobacteraceae bacterium]|nr:phosphoglycerate kinase [Desulfobacteraceae bacterium]
METLFVEDLEVRGKTVITRVDFNVPLKDGRVENDKRIRAALPTIEYLKSHGARVVLISHLGRPGSEVVESLSLCPVAEHLGKLLNSRVKFVRDCQGKAVETAVANLDDGQVLLLENLRFHGEETDNDPAFAARLAQGADIYVNDAFGTAHRAHASTHAITRHVKQAACGYLVKKEIDFLGNALHIPKPPFVAIIGGAKIAGKIDVIKHLLPKVDRLIIGGGMACTFLKAQGAEIGASLCEDDKIPLAKELMAQGGDKLVLPTDYTITDHFDFNARTMNPTRQVKADEIPKKMMAVDIGPASIKLFSEIILESKTVVWNGPMGVAEIDASAQGTIGIAQALAEATRKGAISIIGGGDSAAAIEKTGLADQVSHVSTGGGASLQFLEGKPLPGIEALSQSK